MDTRGYWVAWGGGPKNSKFFLRPATPGPSASIPREHFKRLFVSMAKMTGKYFWTLCTRHRFVRDKMFAGMYMILFTIKIQIVH